MRRAEVVAAGLGVRQELLRHHGAHHVGPLGVTSIVTLSYQLNVDQYNFTHYIHVPTIYKTVFIWICVAYLFMK